jgi:hypothetical protein
LGKAFASIGGVYATTECAIETVSQHLSAAVCSAVRTHIAPPVKQYRAKSDINNSLYAGCLTGGYLARSGVPLALRNTHRSASSLHLTHACTLRVRKMSALCPQLGALGSSAAARASRRGLRPWTRSCTPLRAKG